MTKSLQLLSKPLRAVSPLLAIALSLLCSAAICGIGTVALVWNLADPGCNCRGIRTYLAKVKFTDLHHAPELSIVLVALLLYMPFYKLTQRKWLLPSMIVGAVCGFATWASYGHLLDEDYQTAQPLPFSVNEIAGSSYPWLTAYFLTPISQWRFLCAFGVFLLVSAACGFVVSLKLRAESQS